MLSVLELPATRRAVYKISIVLLLNAVALSSIVHPRCVDWWSTHSSMGAELRYIGDHVQYMSPLLAGLMIVSGINTFGGRLPYTLLEMTAGMVLSTIGRAAADSGVCSHASQLLWYDVKLTLLRLLLLATVQLLLNKGVAMLNRPTPPIAAPTSLVA
jgi:hypothetical protein